MKVFLTGGSGFAGGAILRRLLAEGHQVTALARSQVSQAKVRSVGAQACPGDLTDSQSLYHGLRGQECVVHCAAHFALHGDPAKFKEVNVVGTQALLMAARAAGVSRFIYISAAAVVMDDQGSSLIQVDELHPTNPDSRFPYIASKAQAEQLVLTANGPEMTTLALRPPGIWGPGDAYSQALPKAVSRLSFAWIDGGKAPCVVCNVENLTSAVTLALSRGNGGKAYFINDDEPVLFRDFLLEVGSNLGLRLERFPAVSYPVAFKLGRLVEVVWRFLGLKGEPPLTQTMVRLIGRPFVTNDALARTELGYSSPVSREMGMANYKLGPDIASAGPGRLAV